MTDLVAFLRARLDEDEQVARAATPGPWRWGDWSSNFGTIEQERNTLERAPGYGAFPVVRQRDDEADEVLRLMDPLEIAGDDYPANGAHIARHDPAHVLREVEAKREVLSSYVAAKAKVESRGDCPDGVKPTDLIAAAELGVLKVIVRDLAAVYADHPDYDPAWRVE